MFAITTIQLHDSARSIGGTLYSPCGDAGPKSLMEALLNVRGTAPGGAMVITPPVGKVTYIANVAYTKNAKDLSLSSDYSEDLEGARAFLKAHHPELADRLEQGSYQMMTAEGDCR